jgi:uncharacterized RDD family membrane protein YckC
MTMTQAQNQVVTPEAVPLELETANIGSRFLAIAIDWTIQGVTLFGLLMGVTALLGATNADVGTGIAVALFFLLTFAVLWGYPTVMEALWRGRSLGKAALGLRVVTVEGAPVRFRHAAIRATLGFVDFLLTSGGAAVISMLLTRRSQRLGDLVAGTIVLRERTGLRAPVAVEFPVPAGLEAYAQTVDVARVTADDYSTARAFLLRAGDLHPSIRYDLARRVADAVAAHVQPKPPLGVPPETFLLCIAAVYQHRQARQVRAPAYAPPSIAHQLPPVAPPAGNAGQEGDFSPLA